MARVRFGIFDFDPATGELRRGGVGVRIQSQPAQVLGLLVAHAGEIVTRETLRRAVWGTDTFVDFDRGLNFCVAQIRAALGDSAESPRFVRTIPKRGYQFIAPVGPVAAPPSSEPPPANQAVSGQPFAKQRLVTSALAAALVGTVILLGARLWILRLAPSAPASIRIAVLRFDNQTGSPDLDRFADGLTDSVVAELTDAGGGRYGVIGNAAILRQPRERRDLLAIASSLRVGYVVLGQVQRSPSGIQVLGHLIRLPEQTHLNVVRLEANGDDPVRTQSDLARRIVAGLTPRLASDSASHRASPPPATN
ncbi:MAG: winged helix-turn-helix domain-containing protein [Acidobacteriia bacterium]|nr:winged helix-turn-helix domain-containing protein [Terriglobia bacterium]